MAANPPVESPVVPPSIIDLPRAVEHRLAQHSGAIFAINVLVESDAIGLETAFVDTLEQALDYLANWR